MARKFKFLVHAGQVEVGEFAQRARDMGLEVTGEGLGHITVVVEDTEDGWGAIGCEDRICQVLGIYGRHYPLRSQVHFLHAVESQDPGDFSWASTRAAERERETKG